MTNPARAGLAAVAAVLLVTLVMPGAADGQEATTLTVTPSTGLDEGDIVTVAGGPFPELEATLIFQCAEPVDTSQSFSVIDQCSFRDPRPLSATFDGQGTLAPVPFTVQEVITTQGGGTYDCTLEGNACSIVVAGFFVGPADPDFFAVKAPISFGPLTPQSKADCKNGGWRNLANDLGQPFGNQGQCVRHVVAHPR